MNPTAVQRRRPSRQTEAEKVYWVISELKRTKGNFKAEIEALAEVYEVLSKAEEPTPHQPKLKS